MLPEVSIDSTTVEADSGSDAGNKSGIDADLLLDAILDVLLLYELPRNLLGGGSEGYNGSNFTITASNHKCLNLLK